MFRHHSNGTGTNFRRKFVRRFACHGPSFSRVGVSDKLGAIQDWIQSVPQEERVELLRDMFSLYEKAHFWVCLRHQSALVKPIYS
jgi:hypothetical protein